MCRPEDSWYLRPRDSYHRRLYTPTRPSAARPVGAASVGFCMACGPGHRACPAAHHARRLLRGGVPGSEHRPGQRPPQQPVEVPPARPGPVPIPAPKSDVIDKFAVAPARPRFPTDHEPTIDVCSSVGRFDDFAAVVGIQRPDAQGCCCMAYRDTCALVGHRPAPMRRVCERAGSWRADLCGRDGGRLVFHRTACELFLKCWGGQSIGLGLDRRNSSISSRAWTWRSTASSMRPWSRSWITAARFRAVMASRSTVYCWACSSNGSLSASAASTWDARTERDGLSRHFSSNG